VYAATSAGLFRTTDAGTTWTSLHAPPRLRAVQLFPGCPDTIVVSGDSGVAVSYDAGSRWATMNQGLSTRRVNCLGFAENNGTCLLAGTEGGAAFAWAFPTGLAAAPLPAPVLKSPCLPNPFVSCGRMVGRENEEFVLRDFAGRSVGTFKGARIGVGLPAGVYFAAGATLPGYPIRIVKTR
jgi:hypothetical protein